MSLDERGDVWRIHLEFCSSEKMQAPSGLVVKYEIIQASIEIGVKLIEKKTEGMLWISSNPDVPRIELIIEVGFVRGQFANEKNYGNEKCKCNAKKGVAN